MRAPGNVSMSANANCENRPVQWMMKSNGVHMVSLIGVTADHHAISAR